MQLRGQHNQCPSCGELFNSNAAFDKHRTGEYARRDENGRYYLASGTRECMTPDQMLFAGMDKNAGGWWVTARMPERAE